MTLNDTRAVAMVIHGKICIIQRGRHLDYDDQTKRLVLSNEIGKMGFGAFNVIKVKNKWLMFASYRWYQQGKEYDDKTNQWHSLKMKNAPIHMRSAGCTAILNGKYVLLFGGEKNRVTTNIYDGLILMIYGCII